MRTDHAPTTQAASTSLADPPLPTRLTLAIAWAAFSLLYAYVDILNFYTPGTVEDILDGKVFEFDLSQTFSVSALALVSVPILMAVLSVVLAARTARTTNLVVAALYVPVTLFNLVGDSYHLYYGLGVALELFVLSVVVRRAWDWPRA